MATTNWRVGAFVDRYPGPARDIGRSCKLELVANRMLYETAGVVDPYRLTDATYGGPAQSCGPGEMSRGCCGAPCSTPDSCCSRGTCSGCNASEDVFELVHPEVAAAMDEGHALAAAIRDILTDPDVEDVAGAISQAMSLSKKGQLAALYIPQVPAKKLPSGEGAPARCPICGAQVCPACGCCCACVPSAYEEPAAPAAAE